VFSKFHNLLLVLVVLTVLFVGVGDSFLPQPLSTYSRSSRTAINKYFLSFFPKKQPLRPSGQREDQVKELERKANPHPPTPLVQ